MTDGDSASSNYMWASGFTVTEDHAAQQGIMTTLWDKLLLL